MKSGKFELLSVEEMMRKYGLTADCLEIKRLDPHRVPLSLWHLIPLAEFLGHPDDTVRQDFIRKSSRAALRELKKTIAEHDDLLDEWLAGPEALGPTFSEEYTAFSAMRMLADFA